MSIRHEPDDRPGGDFCEIQGEAPTGHVYLPCRADDLPWLIREVWSIMDQDQQIDFLREVVFPNFSERHVLPLE